MPNLPTLCNYGKTWLSSYVMTVMIANVLLLICEALVVDWCSACGAETWFYLSLSTEVLHWGEGGVIKVG